MKHSELRHQPRHVNPRIQDMRYPLTIFDILVEGMLDVFLGRRGKTLYTDADNCARTYISIKKQIDAIKKLREEA